MTPNLLGELEKMVALSEKATPGEWSHHESHSDTCGYEVVQPFVNGDTVAGEYGISEKADAEYIAALHNWFRTHAPALADMAKRMEAAERDAPKLTDAQCDAIYSALDEYGREVDPYEFGLPWHYDDGPEKRRAVIRAAIDATQEGEG